MTAPVRQWFEVNGSGSEPFVLLHPGGADSRVFGSLLPHLGDRYRVLTPDRRGHGRTPDVDGPLTYAAMADDTSALIDAEVGAPVHLLGYSDGAVVALEVARRRPDLVRDVVLVAGVFHRDGWEPGVLEEAEAVVAPMADAYAEVSPDGPGHYPVVVAKNAQMRRSEPVLTEEDVAAIGCPTLVIVGDDDEVSLEHAIAMYRALPRGELAVVPHASHGVLVEHPAWCASLVRALHDPDRGETFAPRRRAGR